MMAVVTMRTTPTKDSEWRGDAVDVRDFAQRFDSLSNTSSALVPCVFAFVWRVCVCSP